MLIGANGGWAELSKVIPEKIGKYRFKKAVRGGLGGSEKAVYFSEEDGKEVFVKLYPTKRALNKEYYNQKLFFELVEGEEYITVPEPIGQVDTNAGHAMIMEYISDSIVMLDAEEDVKSDVYIRVLKFLNRCKVANNLPKKTSAYQLATLPYFLIMNSINFRSQMALFIKCFIKIIEYSPRWLRLEHAGLCQGDFNVANVILSKDKLIILDFSDVCISHKYFNLSQALNSSWYDGEFQDLLWEKVIDEFDLGSDEEDLLGSFVLFNLMQRLCKRYKNPKQENYYVNKMKRIVSQI